MDISTKQHYCSQCRYFRYRKTNRGGQPYVLMWCDNQYSDNYKQTLDKILTCVGWDGKGY